MLSTLLIIASVAFAETKSLALQIALDQQGFSCSTIDGNWQRKSERALANYLLERHGVGSGNLTPDEAFDRYFADSTNLFRIEEVTQADLDAVCKIPDDPAQRAKLVRMGYESIKEMFAERGHLSQQAMERINPGVDWEHVAVGTKLVIPDFPAMNALLKTPERKKPGTLIRISLGNFEIRIYDRRNKMLALFPCSIAASKSKRPPAGELKVMTALAHPNYTYTPDYTPTGKKPKRFVWPEGENSPIGVAWLGLNLPGYGIHGNPKPESIGYTGSHGCFRLANWNAARIYSLCPIGTKVLIEP